MVEEGRGGWVEGGARTSSRGPLVATPSPNQTRQHKHFKYFIYVPVNTKCNKDIKTISPNKSLRVNQIQLCLYNS